MAAENGHTAMVEILVKAGADVNKVSHVGCGEALTSRRRRVDPNTLYSLSCIRVIPWAVRMELDSTPQICVQFIIFA